MDLLSVIIPVHNGEKYIKKTVSQILHQSYRNIELILVENFSKDNSLRICRELEAGDARVRVLICTDPGTSMARKKGILEANGRYIVFSDQDDYYINKYALERMHAAIVEDQVQICQFGHYKEYQFGIKRREAKSAERHVLSKEEFCNHCLPGLIRGGENDYTTTVWSKIYEAQLLKDAVKDIDIPLYYVEDQYLNLKTVMSETFYGRIAIRNESYYVWKTYSGFSSNSENALVLFDEYKYLKSLSMKVLHKLNCSDEMVFQCHCETIYCLKTIVDSMISRKESKQLVMETINHLDQYEFVQQAKAYIAEIDRSKKWDELEFLTSNYSSADYYAYCLAHRLNIHVIKRAYYSIFK